MKNEGEQIDDKGDELDPEEAIEFLKLVEQARAEAGVEEAALEAPPNIPKPKKRFRLKSKGKKKESESKGPAKVEKPRPVSPGKTGDGEVRLAPDVLEKTKALKSAKKATKQKDPDQAEPPVKKSRWLEVMLACAVVAFIVQLALPGADGSPAHKNAPVVTLNGLQPDAATLYFLRAIYSGRLEEARSYLSPEKRRLLSEEQFRGLVSRFLETDRKALTRISISSFEIDGSRSELRLDTFEADAPWNVSLVKEGDAWYVDGLSGGLEI